MKKICFLNGDMSRTGGTERVTAMIANELSKNSQYEIHVLSVTNEQMISFFELDSPVYHTSVLRLIKTVVDNSHKHGIWTGICGELGADTEMTKLFLAMGVDELSVSPGAILPIKKIILETDVSKIRDEELKNLESCMTKQFTDTLVSVKCFFLFCVNCNLSLRLVKFPHLTTFRSGQYTRTAPSLQSSNLRKFPSAVQKVYAKA